MKKFYLLPFIFMFLILACQKSNDSTDNPATDTSVTDTNYGIFATLDGKDVSFKYGLEADTTYNSVDMWAWVDSTISGEHIQLEVIGYPLVPATYKVSDISAVCTYYANHMAHPATNDVIVTVTSLTKTTVQGTFQGTFYKSTVNGTEYHTFTKGKFNLKLTKP